MTDITLTNEVSTTFLGGAGSDLTIAQAAWVSANTETDESRVAGLLNYLMKHRHGSPFEQGWLQFELHIPIFVARELVRHRIGVSLNEMSGRYTKLEPIFWIPKLGRGLINVGTSARPKMGQGSHPLDAEVIEALEKTYQGDWDIYEILLAAGVANEVARVVLPVGIYTRMHVTFNPRSLMHLLSLRINSPDNMFATYPMAEIEEMALQMEDAFKAHWPLTHAAFVKNGRVSP